MGCTEDISGEIYFDNNATTRPLPEVTEAMHEAMGEGFGNPSSAHSAGERARRRMDLARKRTSDLVGCSPEDLIFTSSGTESNNMVFYSCTGKKNRPRIVTTQVEHSSIMKMCNFLELNDVHIEMLEVDEQGVLDIQRLEDALSEKTDLVSVQWVNNETGVIQDMASISELCRKNSVLLHTDAAQAVGKLKVDLAKLHVDFLSFTAHKISGPQGAAVLYAKDRLLVNPFLFGGFQEEGFRPGTENLPGIAGLGTACEIRHTSFEQDIGKMRGLRDQFEKTIIESIPDTSINGGGGERVCNTTNIHFGGTDGRKLVSLLDEAGIRCSQSSACTNFDVTPSYVLTAMGLDEQHAYSSIRFSFCPENSFEETQKATEIIREKCEFLRNHPC
ncbi:MAG: cysteine desulfurase [Candidatus Dadabacteria bacterium]|nr:cysteine desulfurase [Candidatus Dadabacteria bacterium]